MNKYIKFCVGLLMLTSCDYSHLEKIVFEYVDPLDKIIPDRTYYENIDAQIDVALGEHATAQFVILSPDVITDLEITSTLPKSDDGNTLDSISIRYVDYIKCGRPYSSPPKDKLISSSGYYPDPLKEEPLKTILPNIPQAVWVTIPIPINSIAGLYTSKISIKGKVQGKQFVKEKNFSIKVYPINVDKSSLFVTNWWSGLSPIMNNGKNIDLFSDVYWNLINETAKMMANYRQNVIQVPLHTMIHTSFSDGHYKFDYSDFDKFVDIFIKAGVNSLIEGSSLGGREAGWESDLVIYTPIPEGDTIVNKSLRFADSRAKFFLSEFLPSLTDHLKKRNLFSKYIQHIADEPIAYNAKTYNLIAQEVRKLSPEMRVIEASHGHDVASSSMDIWCPILNGFNEDYDFFKKEKEKGKEIWFYVCAWPQGDYANRYIEQPLLKTRLLHWINFKYNATGFLHWGFNAWTENPFEEASRLLLPDVFCPAGDSWIVYPKNGGYLSSLRLEASRDGIADYELLRMLQVKNPNLAQSIVNRIIISMRTYDTNISNFRNIRRELLESLVNNANQ